MFCLEKKLGTDLNIQQVRFARPTDQLEEISRFYCHGLGFEIVADFYDHAGFDGIMLSMPNASYHLEFTHEHGTTIGRATNRDNLMVFYIPDGNQCQSVINRMISSGYQPVQAHNPYWDKNGVTFEDPDGYCVVIQKSIWQP